MAEFAESLAEILPLSRLRQSFSESTETWAALEKVGLFGMAAAEDLGGSGVASVDEALVIAGLGRRLACPSVLATLAAVHAEPKASRAVPWKRVTVGFEKERIVVVRDPAADALLLRRHNGASLLALNKAAKIIDDRTWLAELVEPSSLGEEIGTFGPDNFLRVRLIDAAFLVGMAQASLEMAVEYAKVREQFGRPIGSFQAIKHHCANMAISARIALDLTTYAAKALTQSRGHSDILIHSAFLLSASAAIENASKNIQIHGGFGFSDESDAHLFLKRAQLHVAIAGGTEAAIARLARITEERQEPFAFESSALTHDEVAPCRLR